MPAGAAQQRSYFIESFDVRLRVEESGTLDVLETIRFRFDGSFEGIYRDLPIRYDTPWNLNYRLRVKPVGAIDEGGGRLRFETDERGDDLRFKVFVPGAVDASRTVILHYRVKNGLRYPDEQEGFAAHDQLYWSVTGNGWTVPIEKVRAEVVLPDGVVDEPWVRSFSGPYGAHSDEGVDVTRLSNNRVRWQVDDRLEPGEGLTIVVGWPPGAVRRPTAVDKARDTLADNWPLGLPLLIGALMLGAFSRFGRDPRIDRSVVVSYEPPGDLRPAELGTLIDEKVDLRDVVATVIDLAVRGYLKITESEVDGWFKSSTKTHFERLPAPSGEVLWPFEQQVLDGLFEGGDNVEMDDLKTKFYKHLSTIQASLYDRLTDRGYFRGRPDHVRKLWIFIAVALASLGIVFGLVTDKPAFIFAGIASAIIVGIFAPFMPARTASGRMRYLETKGFEEFLGRTEGERLRELELSDAVFERFLPYAMAFGVADHWAKGFEGLLTEPPSWYAGPTGQFHPMLFNQRMNTLSSGSSGFSGGGFGGGGGGAF